MFKYTKYLGTKKKLIHVLCAMYCHLTGTVSLESKYTRHAAAGRTNHTSLRVPALPGQALYGLSNITVLPPSRPHRVVYLLSREAVHCGIFVTDYQQTTGQGQMGSSVVKSAILWPFRQKRWIIPESMIARRKPKNSAKLLKHSFIEVYTYWTYGQWLRLRRSPNLKTNWFSTKIVSLITFTEVRYSNNFATIVFISSRRFEI